MTPEEMSQVFNSISKINFAEMEIQDQIEYLNAMSQFADQVKPLVVKYVDRLPEKSTFLFKM